MNKTLVSGLALAAAALLATSAMAAKDDFNRAQLGKKWVVPQGNLYITNDQLQGDSLSLGYYKKSSKDSEVSVTAIINNPAETEYGAAAIGDIASGNNAFVKIQTQNGDSAFEYGGFYVGNNGGGDFFALDTPAPSPAKMTVSLCGSVATLTVKSSAGTQKYSYDYGTSFGTGGGLGTYGQISLDDYKSGSAKCKADEIGAKRITHSTAKDLSLAK